MTERIFTMNKHFLKVCSALLAASLLLTSCGGNSDTTSKSTTEASAVSDVTTAPAHEPTTDVTTEAPSPITPVQTTVTITEDKLYDKLLGGWIGQMAGVSLFAQTEFGAAGQIMTEERVDRLYADWEAGKLSINDAFGQDDLYVEIPFLEAMKENGAFCTPAVIAEKFRDTEFQLWHANNAARQNLRDGILYPDSGSYLYNQHADDIDWQIECDFLGQMYPGYVNDAAYRSYELGHIICYGDGVYGGVFVTAMHAAAYTASSLDEIIEAGLSVIPEDTQFKNALNLVMESYENGDTWQECWKKLENEYGTVDKCPEMNASADKSSKYNIDAKLNSAYILVGLLWGEGDFEQSMIIAGRCGQDSDCNPSSVASILGNYYGASAIPEKYTKGLDYTGTNFSETDYNLEEVLAINFDLMKEILTANGAVYADGTWTIERDTAYEAVAYEQWADNFEAAMTTTDMGGGIVKIEMSFFGDETPEKIEIDMGDGFVAYGNLAYYAYKQTGEYTVKYTVTGDKGTVVTHEKLLKVENKAVIQGTPIASVTAPTGGGSKDMSVMMDGVKPAKGSNSSAVQYDTYCGGAKSDFVYAGIQFSQSFVLTGVHFTEGKHFKDGGWFVGAPYVEVLVDGKWVKQDATISEAYPTGSTMDDFGSSFETYTFTFTNEVACDGVRIAGIPGGSAYFVSIAEIEPIAGEQPKTDIVFTDNDIPLVICNETVPTGGGSDDLRIIADGVLGSDSKTQYDTYAGAIGAHPAYVGYLYKETKTVKTVEFTEGGHFKDGGWFSGKIRIEALVNGEWITVDYTVTPEYPKDDTTAQLSLNYETYVFELNEAIACEGIRICGTAGGTSGFISVSELTIK